MFRDDGSIKSANTPEWDNRYQIRDYGLYRGVVIDVVHTDSEKNDSGRGTPNEVVYWVAVIGGDRDGQVFANARLIKGLGGFSNFEEITLKKTEGITKLDPANPIAQVDPSLRDVATFNGDVVYFQFLNGDIHMPVIVGLGHHQAAEVEATNSEGPRLRKKFNGIYKEITKDGEFTWSKDNGAYLPFSLNTKNPLYPYVSQFAPFPSQEEAVKIKLGNKYDFSFEYSLGLKATIDGLADEYSFGTTLGTSVKITGLTTDSVVLSTKLGTTFKVAGGASDAIEMATKVGASIKIAGLSDEITAATKGGTSLALSTTSGVTLKNATGDQLTMSKAAVTLKNATGAQLAFDAAGFVKLGNAQADALKILAEFLQSMSTATYSGFGAPGSNVADLAKLAIQIKLVTGG